MGSLKDGVSEFTQSDRVELPLYSACMNYFNKPCDGANAIVLKNFFDYLSKNEEKTNSGKGFYEIESELAASVSSSDKKNLYFKYVEEILDKCIKLIGLNEKERALAEYKFMIKNLKEEFGM